MTNFKKEASTAIKDASSKQVTTAVGGKKKQIMQLLDSRKEYLKLVLPRHIPVDRIINNAIIALSSNPDLLKCTDASLVGSIIKASQLGLSIDGLTGEAYLIPFKNGRKNITEAQLVPGYKGLMKLATNTGVVSPIVSKAVHENDEFEYEFGMEAKFKYKPTTEAPGPVVYFFAYTWVGTKDNKEFVFEVLTKAQVDAIKAKARSKKVWDSDYEAMGKKSCIRRLCGTLPSSQELALANELTLKNEIGENTVIDLDKLDQIDDDGKIIHDVTEDTEVTNAE